uniref:ARHGB factor n=1 Tax=Macrostomum lignano TaxID=282301 RepID=A0A1I8JS05_9PLAT
RHSGSGGSGQAGPSQRPSEAPEEGRLLSWLVREGAEPARFSSKLLRQGRSLLRLRLLRTPREMLNRLLSEETLQNAGETAGGQSAWRRGGAGAKRRLEFSQLTEVANPAQRTRAAQAEALPRFGQAGICRAACDFPSPSCLLSFLTRRLEQADPLDPWLSRLLLNVRQILETASSTSFGYGLPSSQSGFQIPARSRKLD